MKKLVLLAAIGSLLLSACNCNSCKKDDNAQCAEGKECCAVKGDAMKEMKPTGPTVNAMGQPIQLFAQLPKVGSEAPEVMLTPVNLEDAAISSFQGHTVVLNIFPSVDTKTCSMSVRQFNELAAGMPNVKVLCVSMDLPFALARFCGAEGIENVQTMSAFRSEFPEKYGVKIATGRLRGLLARAVIVVKADGKVGYTQLVQEMGNEPNYDEVVNYLKEIAK